MSNVNTISNSVLSGLSSKTRYQDDPQDNELGQTAFLELMIAQLNNQDPLSPKENGEFIAQLAQFSSVEGLERLNNNFDSFASSFTSNQALQASSLVGRSVTVPSETGVTDMNGVISGVIELPESTSNVNMKIYDETGQLVDEIDLGSQPAQDMVFRWNGAQLELNGELLENYVPANGQALPPGKYTIRATASQGGEQVGLATSVSANVNSVTLGNGGAITLNLAGIGPMSIEDVKQFN
ncbi:MAG TPA: flagellar hook assembly protein FlgD [Pseudomonadales bacterium]|nr:flagellar hook assembly protein FlgD [Pseudomonadales bacterium]HSG62337.1 flagellar hook assembly protein FlgD [Pseudomonadales bacterium]